MLERCHTVSDLSNGGLELAKLSEIFLGNNLDSGVGHAGVL